MFSRIFRRLKSELNKLRKTYIKLIQKILVSEGFVVYKKENNKHYVLDYFGRSSHKQKNIRSMPIFGEIAEQVIKDKRTSLYYDRLFTIFRVLDNLKRWQSDGKIRMAEIGVYKGGSSYFIASVADRLGLPYTHYGFDTFEGHSETDINPSVETTHKPGSFSDTSFEAVKDYLSVFVDVNLYKGRFQDTCPILGDMVFHFVHLDMDIYEPTKFSLDFFSSRLFSGGIILLDDYGFTSCPGIERAVNEFLLEHSDYFGMPLLSGQYILLKL